MGNSRSHANTVSTLDNVALNVQGRGSAADPQMDLTGSLPFLDKFIIGELNVNAGRTVLTQGIQAAQHYAVKSGVGIRYRVFPDNSRKTFGFVVPGDLIGFQAKPSTPLTYCVDATSAMQLSVLDRDGIWDMLRSDPQATYELLWKTATDAHFLNAGLASRGQQTGPERMAWVLLTYFTRVHELTSSRHPSVSFPFRQQDLADIVGLSLVHTNKTISSLRTKGLIQLRGGVLTILDQAALAAQAGLD